MLYRDASYVNDEVIILCDHLAHLNLTFLKESLHGTQTGLKSSLYYKYIFCIFLMLSNVKYNVKLYIHIENRF